MNGLRVGAWVALLGGPSTSPLGGVRASHFFDQFASLCDDEICTSAFSATSPMWRPSPLGQAFAKSPAYASDTAADAGVSARVRQKLSCLGAT